MLVMSMTVRHDPGLTASPHVWHNVEVGGTGVAAPFLVPRITPRSAASLTLCGILAARPFLNLMASTSVLPTRADLARAVSLQSAAV